jgi:hypothetical protein
MHRLIKVLKLLTKTEVAAFPERPRRMATNVLESNELMHLAEHIIKIILWPDSPDYNGWLSEIKTSLFTNLSFGLCRFCTKVENKKRYVSKLWYSAKDIQSRINDLMVDAYWSVEDKMEDNPTAPNPFIKVDKTKFQDLGYTIKEEKDPVYGIRFTLWFKGKKLV